MHDIHICHIHKTVDLILNHYHDNLISISTNQCLILLATPDLTDTQLVAPRSTITFPYTGSAARYAHASQRLAKCPILLSVCARKDDLNVLELPGFYPGKNHLDE